MTRQRIPALQPRTSAGRWKEKAQSAPETGPLNTAMAKEGTAERRFQIRKQQVLARHETAFLYAHLGEPGSDVFESFDRLGELAAEEMVMTAAVDEWSQPGK